MSERLKMMGCVAVIAAMWSQAASAGQVSGELKKWHKVTVTFDGPQTSETNGTRLQ
jgi:hypothetical protein